MEDGSGKQISYHICVGLCITLQLSLQVSSKLSSSSKSHSHNLAMGLRLQKSSTGRHLSAVCDSVPILVTACVLKPSHLSVPESYQFQQI